MSTTTAEARFSFLAAGPTFHFDLPGEFDPLPEVSTPIFNGVGGRSFVFRPEATDEGVTDSSFLRTLEDGGGRKAELYLRRELPTLWRLRWPLSTGAVYTHLREEDGEAKADETVARVRVSEQAQAPPFLMLNSPFQYAASAAAGYQERSMYTSSLLGDGWGITFQRPGFVPFGQVATAPQEYSGGLAVFRAGCGQGMELQVTSGADSDRGRAIVDGVLASLGEG